MENFLEEVVKVSGDEAIFKLNEEIYSKEVILQAAYVLLENIHILIDKKESYFYLYVKVKDKKTNLEEIKEKLIDELIEANTYIEQAKRTKGVREKLLERALLTNSVEYDELMKNKKFKDDFN